MTPKPETEEYNVRNFVYSRRRPFHPLRLFSLLHDKFILQLEEPDEDGDDEDAEGDNESDDAEMTMDEDDESHSDSNQSSSRLSPSDRSTAVTAPTSVASDADGKEPPGGNAITVADATTPANDMILANKRAHPLFARLFRSKGEFFLATRPHRAGDWSQAGAMLTLSGGRPWFCTLPAEEYMTGNPEIDALVQHDMRNGGEWGDRRQELVFIGEKLDVKGLERVLDECLLTDEEFKDWEELMREDESLEQKLDRLSDLFEDGFPDWADPDEVTAGVEHNHDHGKSGH